MAFAHSQDFGYLFHAQIMGQHAFEQLKLRLFFLGQCQFMKGLTLTQKEQARLQVLNGILEGQISVDEAAEVLGSE